MQIMLIGNQEDLGQTLLANLAGEGHQITQQAEINEQEVLATEALIVATTSADIGRQIRLLRDQGCSSALIAVLDQDDAHGTGQSEAILAGADHVFVSPVPKALLVATARKIATQNQRANAALEQDLLSRTALSHIMDSVMICNSKGTIVYVNQPLLDCTEFLQSDLIGRAYSKLIPGHPLEWLNENDQLTRPTTTFVYRHGELKFKADMLRSVLKLANGTVYYMASFRDTRERDEAARRIERLKEFDQLTGVRNQTNAMSKIDDNLAMASRLNHRIAIIVLGPQHIRQINKIHSRNAGDQVLADLGHTLQTQFPRQTDIVGRVNGSEFVIALYQPGGIEQITERVTSLIAATNTPITYDNHQLPCSVSMGISFFPDDGLNTQDLVLYAELAKSAADEQQSLYAFFKQPNAELTI